MGYSEMSDIVNQQSGSHPSIRFEKIPIIPGPLTHFDQIRSGLLADVVQQTREEFNPQSLEILLGESLYLERLRLKRERANLFTRGRLQGDRSLWGQVHSGLLKTSAEVDRQELLDSVIRHYAEEIGGHFDPRVYRFAVDAVPWGFNWLLNAASVRKVLPWKHTESLRDSLRILGEVTALQNLAKKGTILLVPTHQSNIDSVLIGYVIYLMSLPPFAYGAGLNLFSNPVFSFFMSRLGAYTVDRQKTNPIYKLTLKNYSTRILKEGIHSIFFPGGGRSRSGAIESKVKLGLLGTGLEAQIANLQAGNPKSKVFIVPMVMSYHFVLEASSLIENYLAESGKHRYIWVDDESWNPSKIIGFFWKLFSYQSGITVRIGRPMDPFGNFVDEEGTSIGPNGTSIDPIKWLTTCGSLKKEAQRDQEYTRELGARLSERFHQENTVLTSHLVAFAYFEALRGKYPDFDLFRFLRLSRDQRSMPFSEFLGFAEIYHSRISRLTDQGKVYLSDELKASRTEVWVKDGLNQLGLFHDASVIKLRGDVVWTEDMNLLYYYRNRLSGYGLSRLAEQAGNFTQFGKYDSQGFLA